MDARLVLVVDDNRDIASMEAALLRLMGYKTLVCFDVCTALAQLNSMRPDVVISDWNLIGETSARLLEEACEHGVPVITVSGRPDLVEDWRGHASDAVQRSEHFLVLTKPVGIEQLSSSIESQFI
jgi:DNA-binding response OmpR family regulator